MPSGPAGECPTRSATTVRRPPQVVGGLPDAATLAAVTTAPQTRLARGRAAVVLLAIGLGVALGSRQRARHQRSSRSTGWMPCAAPVGAVAPAVPPPTIDRRSTARRHRADDGRPRRAHDAVAARHRPRRASATLTAARRRRRPRRRHLPPRRRRLGAARSPRRARAARSAACTTWPPRCAAGTPSPSASATRSPRACRSGWSTSARSASTPDPAEWSAGTDYSHASKAFADVILPTAPYVDEAALAKAYDDYDTFLRHSLANGYTAVAFPGFLEYVDLRRARRRPGLPRGRPARGPGAGDGRGVRPVLGPAPHELGMKVFLLTDMLAALPAAGGVPRAARRRRSTPTTPPCGRSTGRARRAVRGRAVARRAHGPDRRGRRGLRRRGWDYSSELAVTHRRAVRAMLDRPHRARPSARPRDHLPHVDRRRRGGRRPAHQPAVLRGRAGRHRRPAPDRVDEVHRSATSTATCRSTTTLAVGTHRRIVEFQAAGSSRGSARCPTTSSPRTSEALQRFLAANPHVEGVWNWTQDGGPLRAGPMTLYLRTGFWQLYDLNTYGAARLAWDPDADVGAGHRRLGAADWFSDDPATVTAITEAMARSREAITRGLYIGPFAEQTVKALGLEPPPMMWIFEWDIVTGDSAALDSIYAVSRDRLDEADRRRATRRSPPPSGCATLVAATDAEHLARPGAARVLRRHPRLRDRPAGSARRRTATMVLRHAQWLDTGGAAAHASGGRAGARTGAPRHAHVDALRGRRRPARPTTSPPPTSASTRADRDPAMAWLARVLLALALGWLVARRGAGVGAPAHRRRRRLPRRSWVAATRPWRLGEIGPPRLTRADRALLVARAGRRCWSPAAACSRGSRAPAHLLVALGAWLVLARRRAGPLAARPVPPVGGRRGGGRRARGPVRPACSRCRPPGPGGYWFGFWTEPDARTVYVTVAFAAFLLAVRRRGAGRCGLGAGRRRAAGHRARRRRRGARRAGGRASPLIGLERALTVWNDQMACCRGGSRGSSASPSTSASPPTPRGGPPGASGRPWRPALACSELPPGDLRPWGSRSATPATEDAAEHVPDDAAGVEAGR